jgi:hypothetical protein
VQECTLAKDLAAAGLKIERRRGGGTYHYSARECHRAGNGLYHIVFAHPQEDNLARPSSIFAASTHFILEILGA